MGFFFNSSSSSSRLSGYSRIKLFLSLSRTPHGLLDMATPILGALLWLGEFPSPMTAFLGVFTVFSGYTTVYALNDLIDYHVDKERIQLECRGESENYLDDILIRHPMARGLLSVKEGVYWTVSWAVLTVIGAYMLNPVCVVIFFCAGLLEMFYCFLLRVTHLRAFIAGGVKTSGVVAAIFAVDPAPSPFFLIFLFLWLFFWEIGGQNIPHDWTDMQEDCQLNTQTIPIRFGAHKAALLILVTLSIAFCLSMICFFLSRAGFQLPFLLTAGAVGIFLLIIPAIQLYRHKSRPFAMMLFNKASYYPLMMLFVVYAKLIYSYLK